ncbi:hypothetical protein PGT21_019374 [Puccinia graminis f. sp. tritici]|uniref:CWH43-like N-terminal domain-containing protein n=1 Tax=Puccinia graminis f. sp. tritici TaxID=56615 RepID=A0A5B0PRH3_PUCGR|nr:hypothetical protein PGTUg99_033496 [Puccinia graminis f. sp. tritici]KAA1104327.1 hypothetical protein PGT21_019374 [Puccinia graminis f. sp. tritici]
MKLTEYGAYVWLPIITALGWFTTLAGLLSLRLFSAADIGKHRPDEASVLFISDVGAAHMTWFTPGCTLVALLYIATLLAERWLRHHERIPRVISKRHRYWGYSTAGHGILSGLSLMMLSFLSKFEHPTVHWRFTFMFAICLMISAYSQVIEVFCLKKEYPEQARLRRNAMIKLWIVSIATVLAVVFGVLFLSCGGLVRSSRDNLLLSGAAVCEWAVSFLLTFYFLTFVLDFYPAAKTSSGLEPNKCHSQGKTDSRSAPKMDTPGVFDLKIDLEKSDRPDALAIDPPHAQVADR